MLRCGLPFVLLLLFFSFLNARFFSSCPLNHITMENHSSSSLSLNAAATGSESSKDLLLSEYLDSSNLTTIHHQDKYHPALLLNHSQKPNIQRHAPNTSLLQRIHTILPQLEKANQLLSTHPSSSVDIVDIQKVDDLIQEIHPDTTECSSTSTNLSSSTLSNENITVSEKLQVENQVYVSMNVGLGVFDVLPPSAEPSNPFTSTLASSKTWEQTMLSFLNTPFHPSSFSSTSLNDDASSSDDDSSSESSINDIHESDVHPWIEEMTPISKE